MLNEPLLGTAVSGYARIMRKRRMGKLTFCTARFNQQEVQLILTLAETAEYAEAIHAPNGSIVRIRGVTCLSNTNEFSIRCHEAAMVARCTRSLPDKYHGIDQGEGYSDRVAGLLADPESFLLFRRISLAIRLIREHLWKLGFSEFPTGVLRRQREAGTAGAFVTLCNANGLQYQLSMTSELKLKRLQVAGYGDVFEIMQSFRNEGMDSMHSPEFTLLEAYRSGAGVEDMMGLAEVLVRIALGAAAWGPGRIDAYAPFRRISFFDACASMLQVTREACTLQTFTRVHPQHFAEGMSTFTWVFKVVNRLLAPKLEHPTFITNIPSGISPLVKDNPLDPGTSERAALVIDGLDIADVYADENDPERVRRAMERQQRETGVPLNEEYLGVLAYGLPPSGSIGMGLNRLFLLMRGALPRNIKETILFPL